MLSKSILFLGALVAQATTYYFTFKDANDEYNDFIYDEEDELTYGDDD